METVAYTRADDDGRALRAIAGDDQLTIAVVVTGDCILELAAGEDFTAGCFQLDYLVAVLCFSAVSVVHTFYRSLTSRWRTTAGAPVIFQFRFAVESHWLFARRASAPPFVV